MYFLQKEQVVISAEKDLLPIITLVKDVIEMTCLKEHFAKDFVLMSEI
jgi:hypothetical protein